ncbi:MAG: TfoX/Sxy family protein [Alphaproteobacteria bacterium]|nr:TfoX/Sxy family protein [Alphaproteobacteria bacterium]
MKAPDPFAQQVVGLLTPLGPVRARRMFGGHGIFMDDVMFALIAGDALYFKADAETEDAFRAVGSLPFTYNRNGREISMSYWRAPAGALDDMAALAPWAERALLAARRAKAK